MSDNTLRDLVLKRLDADTRPEDEWSALVLAALEGPDELEKLLEGPSVASPRAPAPSPRAPSAVTGGEGSAISAPTPQQPRIAFLRTITVEGFRGIGPKATLDLTPGPGLTLVVGRNGSGKSSFAEALEFLLTGETYRWENRSEVWRDGGRKLHPWGLLSEACQRRPFDTDPLRRRFESRHTIRRDRPHQAHEPLSGDSLESPAGRNELARNWLVSEGVAVRVSPSVDECGRFRHLGPVGRSRCEEQACTQRH